jgi:hypothetical protein
MLCLFVQMRRVQAICGQLSASSSIPSALPTTATVSSSTTVGGPVGRVHNNRVAIVTGGASGIGEATVTVSMLSLIQVLVYRLVKLCQCPCPFLIGICQPRCIRGNI